MKKKDEKEKISSYKIAQDLMKKYTVITHPETHTSFLLDKRVFSQKRVEALIRANSESMLGEETTIHFRNEVRGHLEALTYEFDLTKFEHPDNLLVCTNGCLTLDGSTSTFGDVLPENGNPFIKIGTKYDPKKKCRKFDKFLGEILDPSDIPLIWEIFGYCLFPGNKYHKAIVFIGEGSNGKSTLLNVLKALLGSKNVTGITLQSFEKNRFVASRLPYKLANICADIPRQALWQTSSFKALTGQDTFYAEKKFKEGFEFVNRAKLIFSCNRLPATRDDTTAFFRRWVLINFPNTFEGDDVDPKLLDKLIVGKELSGILNKSLAAYSRLEENQRFTYTPSTAEIRTDYIAKSDPVWSFSETMIEEGYGLEVLKDEVYSVYTQYCRDHKLPIVQDMSFFKNLKKYVTYTIERRRPSRKQVLIGIAFKLQETLEASRGVQSVQKETLEGVQGVQSVQRILISKEQNNVYSTKVQKRNGHLGHLGQAVKKVKVRFTQEQRLLLLLEAVHIQGRNPISSKNLKISLKKSGYPIRRFNTDLEHLLQQGFIFMPKTDYYLTV